MAIRFACSSCRVAYSADDRDAGQMLICPNCAAAIEIPNQVSARSASDDARPTGEQPRSNTDPELDARRDEVVDSHGHRPVPPPLPSRPRRRSEESRRGGRPADRRGSRRVGRSRSTKILFVIGVFVFAIASAVVWFGLQHIYNPYEQKWVIFEDAGGGFRVAMPSMPSKQNTSQTADGGTMREFQCKRYVQKDTYYVGYFDYFGDEDQREATIDAAVDAAIQTKQLSESSRRWIWNGPYKGREAVLTSGRFSIVLRVQIVGQKCYLLLVSGLSYTPQTPEVLRFLDSFTVTGDPQYISKPTTAPPP